MIQANLCRSPQVNARRSVKADNDIVPKISKRPRVGGQGKLPVQFLCEPVEVGERRTLQHWVVESTPQGANTKAARVWVRVRRIRRIVNGLLQGPTCWHWVLSSPCTTHLFREYTCTAPCTTIERRTSHFAHRTSHFALEKSTHSISQHVIMYWICTS